MVSVFVLQSLHRSQDVKEVIHEEVRPRYLCLYFNLLIGLKISRR